MWLINVYVDFDKKKTEETVCKCSKRCGELLVIFANVCIDKKLCVAHAHLLPNHS